MKKLSLAVAVVLTAVGSLSASEIRVDKPYFRWLFGGLGFQHSEANMMALMSPEFRDQRVLKTFAELMPTFGRVYTGFSNQSREQLDRFADYYDLTFRKAGTTLYAVPCAMQPIREGDDPKEYAEKVAKNLEYLIKVRGCRKIRFYCLTNELMVGDEWDWFSKYDKMEVYKAYNNALFDAFRAHELDIRILATDKAVTTKPYNALPSLVWARDNMNDVIGMFCSHWYVYGRRTDELCLWQEYNEYFKKLVQTSLEVQKRFVLGEFGFHPAWGKTGVMQDDVSYHLRQPETAGESVLAKCEVAMAAINQGAFAAIDWSFVDYPDPFIVEDGDTPQERAIYEAGKCGYRLDHKYNKCGLFRWGTTDRDYSSYHELYAMGHLARLFRKGATVLPCQTDDDMLRASALMNGDQTISMAIINRGKAREVTVNCRSFKPRTDGKPTFERSLRRYVYEADNVPFNAFNDLQGMKDTLTATAGIVSVSLPAKSMTFLTTDYEESQGEAIAGIKVAGDKLVWNAASSPNHRYYRVYRDGKQIASTVATSLPLTVADGAFTVTSVDKWLNETQSR